MSVKRRVLTLKDKLSVVEMRDKGYSYARIATEFQIGKSTVFDIVRGHVQTIFGKINVIMTLRGGGGG